MIILEVVMVAVVVYVLASFATFIWMLWDMRFRKIPARISNNHPEMQDVKRHEQLLTVRFSELDREGKS